ncbi:hypothetical protein ACVWYI_003987 [Bradyrhizobium sp. LB13.1]
MVSACSRSVCSLRLFSCSSFPLMLASSLVMVLSDCARSDDEGSGAVAPVLGMSGVGASGLEASGFGALSVSLLTGGAGTGPGPSAAASCMARGCAGLSTADACGGWLVAGGAHRAMIDLLNDLASSRYCEAKAAPRRPIARHEANQSAHHGPISLQALIANLASWCRRLVPGRLVPGSLGRLRSGACLRGPRAFAAAFHSGNQPVQPRKVLLCALDLVIRPRQPAFGAHRVRLFGIRLGVVRLRQRCALHTVEVNGSAAVRSLEG